MNNKKIFVGVYIPIVISEMMDTRIMDLRFKNKGEIVFYLLDAYVKSQNGVIISKTVRKILKKATPERSPIFMHEKKKLFGMYLDRDWTKALTEFATNTPFNTRNNLANALVEAFVSSAPVTLKILRKEMDNRKLIIKSSDPMFETYISKYQYILLKSKADSQGICVATLLHSVVTVILQYENDQDTTRYVPVVLKNMIVDTMKINGYTTRDFRRDIKVSIRISGENEQMQIFQIMQKYQIPTQREFARRIVLFFLNAELFIFQDRKKNDDKYASPIEDDNESYWYNRYAQQDYKRSLYPKTN